MGKFLDCPKRVRFSKECMEKIVLLRENFPTDYKTDSDVIRAGIFALYRWKYGREGMQK